MICTEVGNDVIPQAGERTVALASDFDCPDLGASMNCGLDVLATRLDPLHRFAELHRDPADQSLFRVNIQFRAKSTAYFRSNYAQLVFRNADHQSELGSQQVRDLRR